MANSNDCWIVHYGNGRCAETPIRGNAHETLFIANRKSGQTMTKIVSIFKNEWFGNRHRSKYADS